MIQSHKEGMIGKVFLSEETIDLFNRLWKTVPESEYAFSGPSGERYDQSGINKMLKRAAKKAGLEDLKLHQHSFRKLWITSAINLGLQEIVIKILTFKSVPQDMLTYFLDREDLRDQWKKVTDFLSLEPRANGRVNNLEEMIDLMAKDLTELLKPIVRTMWLQQQQGGGQSLGFMEIPNFEGMSERELLKEYLRLLKE